MRLWGMLGAALLGVGLAAAPAEAAGADTLIVQERRRSPFAVASEGRAARPAERVVVVLGSAATRAATPAPAPSAASPASPAVAASTAPTPNGPDPPRPVPAAERDAARRVHRVSPGESLWGISRRYGVSTDALRQANRLDGDRVIIGQTLVIPGGEED